MRSSLILATLLFGLPALAAGTGATGTASLDQCFQDAEHYQGVEESAGQKKVYKVRTPQEIREGCLKKALQMAKASKSVEQILAIGESVGKNSNWANAPMIYEVAAKRDQRTCSDSNLQYSVFAGLEHPADFIGVKPAKAILSNSCWPALKEAMIKALKDNSSGYLKDHVCEILKAKAALDTPGAEICKS